MHAFDSIPHLLQDTPLPALWRWWLKELLGCLPQKLVESLKGWGQKPIVDMTSGTVLFCRAGEQSILLPENDDTQVIQATAAKSCVLVVPEKHALVRPLSFPLTSTRNLRRIIGYEMDRICPLDVSEVYFDFEVTQRDRAAKRMSVNIRMVKRTALDTTITRCQELGLQPSFVHFGAHDQQPFRGLQIGPKGIMGTIRQEWRLPLASVGLACILATSVLVVSILRDQREMAAVQAKAEAIHQISRSAKLMQSKIASARQDLALLSQKKKRTATTAVLAEVARVLPDDSWLFDLETVGQEVRIRGYSPASSSLIAVFDASRLFGNTRFRSPQTPVACGNVERFDLSFDLKEGK